MRINALLVLGLMLFASMGANRSLGQATPLPMAADDAFTVANALSGIPRPDFDRLALPSSQFQLSDALQARSMQSLAAWQSALRSPTDGVLLELLIANDNPGMRPEHLLPLGTGSGLTETAARLLFRRPREAEPPAGSWVDLSRSGFRWIVRRGEGFVYVDLVGEQAVILRHEARALARSSEFRNTIFSASFFMNDPDAEDPTTVVSCAEYAERLVSPQLSDFTNRANAINSIYCGTPDVVAAEARLRTVVGSIGSAVGQGRSRRDLAIALDALVERHTLAMRTLQELVAVCEGNRVASAGDAQCKAILDYIRVQLDLVQREAAAQVTSLAPLGPQGRWARDLFRLAEDHAAAISSLAAAARADP